MGNISQRKFGFDLLIADKLDILNLLRSFAFKAFLYLSELLTIFIIRCLISLMKITISNTKINNSQENHGASNSSDLRLIHKLINRKMEGSLNIK